MVGRSGEEAKTNAREVLGEACSVFDELKNMKCRWASYYVLN